MTWLRMPLNPRFQRWPGQVVWLVGASTGIGRATAELLHARGATVIVSARNAAALQKFVDGRERALALPLYDGEIGIAPGHSPMIGRLGYGEMRLMARRILSGKVLKSPGERSCWRHHVTASPVEVFAGRGFSRG